MRGCASSRRIVSDERFPDFIRCNHSVKTRATIKRCLLINVRLALWSRAPALMNPEPLIRVAPDMTFDRTGRKLSQQPHVAALVARSFNLKRRAYSQHETTALRLPRREDWNHVRARAQRKLCH